jgi:ABC-type glycerol-3-phosphate transport system substrate-binding protein
MRNKALLLTMGLAVLLALASPALAGEKIKLTWWDPYGPPWDALLEKGVGGVAARHPDWDVKHEHVPWTGLIQKLTVAVASGTAPDAAHIWGTYWATNLAVNSVVLPLDDMIAKDKDLNLNDIYKGYLDSFRWKGKIWGFPDSAQPTSWLWSKQVFRESGLDPNKPPSSWEDVIAMSDKITKKDPAGNLVRIGFIPNNMWNGFYNFASHWGGSFYDERTGKVAVYNPTVLDALKWQVNFTKRYGGQELISAFQSGFGGGADQPMLTGKLGMMMATHYHYYGHYTAKPDFEYGFAPPVLPGPILGDETRGGMVCANAHVVFASTKNPQQAYELVRDYMTVGVNVWSSLSAHASVNRKWNEEALDKGLVAKWYPAELWRQDAKALLYNRPLAPIPNMPLLLSELGAQTDLARLGKTSPEEALRHVDEVVNRDLDKILKR